MSEWPDVEGALKTWLSAHYLLTPIIANKVFFGVPSPMNPPVPLIALSRIGGGPQSGGLPLDDAVIQLDCWGRSKQESSDLARLLIQVLVEMEAVRLDSATVGHGASDISSVWIPDPSSKLGRYSVTATVTASAAVAA